MIGELDKRIRSLFGEKKKAKDPTLRNNKNLAGEDHKWGLLRETGRAIDGIIIVDLPCRRATMPHTMVKRTLEQRRAQTEKARAARLQRRLQGRGLAARAVDIEDERGIAEARAAAAATTLVPYEMPALTPDIVYRRSLVPAIPTQE